MTDPVTREFYPVPELTIVDPSPGTVRNGQCAPDGFGNNRNNQQQQHVRSPVRHEPLTTGQEMKIADSVEGEGLLESSLRLKPHEAQNYRKKALWVSWISIVVTLILAVTAFTVSFMRHSASAFGFAFDATLDVLSSIIVLWRYSNAAAVHSAHREYIACVVLGIVFVLCSLCILGKAIHNLVSRMPPEVDDFLFSVSIVSGFVCTVLAVAKFMLGKVLTSRALITDGFNSLVGGFLGFTILISAQVFKDHPDVWFLDGLIGFLIGLIILAYGVKLLMDMVPRVRQTRNYERFE
ncbi:transmembrane protein 163a-like [Phyllopteryx taeniolatus]|uniref:transmembrane protein 163a-like n=1 Tax=Phyllopteryx taeniolatus TaxID=161469 RepID=UPI002AD2AC61|nr:transmembrane protein 163a-like [Phyllopteryx taeniolatus]